MRKRVLLSMCLLLIAALPAPAQQKVGLVFSAGPTGGSWTPMAAATAEVIKKRFPELDVQVEPGAALVNMEKIRNDKADLGLVHDHGAGRRARRRSTPGRASRPTSPCSWPTTTRTSGSSWCPVDSDVRKFADLKGKAVALPPRGNTSLSEGWELLLRLSGMKMEDLGTRSFGSITENVEAIRTGRRSPWAGSRWCPPRFMLDLGTSSKLRMIPVPDDVHREAAPGQPRVRPPRHPQGRPTRSTAIDEDVVTVQAPTILIAHAKTPADVIYRVTKAIVEGREDFARVTAAMKGVTAKDMAQSYGLPVPPRRREVLP